MTSTGRAAAFLLLVALAAHGAGLRNGFVYDDHRFVVDNAALAEASPAELFLDPAAQTSDDDRDIYRPLRALGHAFDRARWGLEPFGFHLHSLLAHVAAVLLGFAVLRRLLPAPSDVPALLGATVLACHPLGAETVGWITSRGDIYALALALAALLAGSRLERARSRPAAAGLAALTALLAAAAVLGKESAGWVLPVGWLWRRQLGAAVSGTDAAGAAVAGRDGPARTAGAPPRRLAVPALAAGVFAALALRHWALAGLGPNQTAPHGGSWIAQAGWALFGTGTTLGHVLWPAGLSVEYPQLAWAARTPSPWLSPAALGALLVLAAAIVLRRRAPAASFLAGWALLAYLPSSSLLVTLRGLVNDRAAYPLLLPLGALAGLPLARRPRAALAAAAVAAVLLVPAAARRTAVFHDDRSLWSDVLARDPRSVSAHIAFAAEAGSVDDEHRWLAGAAAAAEPGSFWEGLALARLGDFELRHRRRPDVAESMLRRALDVLRARRDRAAPGSLEAPTAASLAEALTLLGRHEEAEAVLRLCLLEQPGRVMLLVKRATLGLLRVAREGGPEGWEIAEDSLARAKRLAPGAPEVAALERLVAASREAAAR